MGKMEREKGKRGERMWAKLLTEHGFPAMRGVQYKGGEDSPDVVCESLPLHFEVKLTERLHIRKAMEQAITDSCFAIPVVAFKQKRKDWLCILEADDFFKILKLAYGGRSDEREQETRGDAGTGVRPDDDGGAHGAAASDSPGGGAREADQEA